MSPSQKREYSEWIVEAKTDATRDKRLGIAVGWIAEGKSRNWKYQAQGEGVAPLTPTLSPLTGGEGDGSSSEL